MWYYSSSTTFYKFYNRSRDGLIFKQVESTAFVNTSQTLLLKLGPSQSSYQGEITVTVHLNSTNQVHTQTVVGTNAAARVITEHLNC